ncbi:enoyl-CoA hydratase-related protein [Pseudonocardia sp. NPDC049154]|uniref:enoyl-CoA hydratase/isomerase family protein n=1 Tax=Pseudonocardia sp. NPDC049154 TaxID=3155501 RepID=UPI0033CFE10C
MTAATRPVPPRLQDVSVELTAGVATVLLDRPEAGNAWTIPLALEMSRAMTWCDETDEVRAVVLGARGRVFCVGADLSGRDILKPGATKEVPEAQVGEWMLPSAVRKPVVAALQGHAVGIGTTYALHCDLRFVAEDATMGLPFVRRGIVPEANASWLLPRIVGLGTAMDLVLTGRLVRGREAVELGLAHRALPKDRVLVEAQEWAAQVAADGAPLALGVAKRLLWDGQVGTSAASRDAEHAAFTALAAGADVTEGVASFLEKRSPQWTQGVSRDWPAELGS